MSNDTPQPGAEPDPFAELLSGLAEDPALAGPAAAVPSDIPAGLPGLIPQAEIPTVAMPAPQQPGPGFPGPAFPGAEAPTVVLPGTQLDPTAATTLLAGGSGGEPPVEPPSSGYRSWDRNRKILLWVLVGVAAILLIAIIVLLVALLSPKQPSPGPTPTGSSSPTPTKSVTPRPTVTPTPTKSPTATPTPTPTPTKLPTATIDSYSVGSNTAVCPDSTSTVQVSLSWATTNASQIALAYGSSQKDAINSPNESGLPAQASGHQSPFQCGSTSIVYSLTVAGPDGAHTTQVVTVARQITPPATPTIGSWSPSASSVGCDTATNNADQFTLTYQVTNWVSGDTVEFGIGGASPAQSSYTVASYVVVGLPGGGPGSDFTTFQCSAGTQTYYATLFDASHAQLDQKTVTITLQP